MPGCRSSGFWPVAGPYAPSCWRAPSLSVKLVCQVVAAAVGVPRRCWWMLVVGRCWVVVGGHGVVSVLVTPLWWVRRVVVVCWVPSWPGWPLLLRWLRDVRLRAHGYKAWGLTVGSAVCCCGRACCCGSFTAGCQGVPVACKGGGAVSWLLHVPCPARVPVLWLVAGGKRLRQFVGVGCSHGQLVGVGRLGTWLVTSRVFLCSFSCTCVLSTLGVRGLLRCGLRVSSRSGKVLLNFSVRCVELLVVLGRQGSSRSSLCSDLWPAKALGTRATRALGAPSAELLPHPQQRQKCC